MHRPPKRPSAEDVNARGIDGHFRALRTAAARKDLESLVRRIFFAPPVGDERASPRELWGVDMRALIEVMEAVSARVWNNVRILEQNDPGRHADLMNTINLFRQGYTQLGRAFMEAAFHPGDDRYTAQDRAYFEQHAADIIAVMRIIGYAVPNVTINVAKG